MSPANKIWYGTIGAISVACGIFGSLFLQAAEASTTIAGWLLSGCVLAAFAPKIRARACLGAVAMLFLCLFSAANADRLQPPEAKAAAQKQAAIDAANQEKADKEAMKAAQVEEAKKQQETAATEKKEKDDAAAQASLEKVREELFKAVGTERTTLNPFDEKGRTPVADSPEALDIAIAASQKGDNEGMAALFLEGKVGVLEKGTRVKVAKYEGGSTYQVQVLSGANIMQNVWVPFFCLADKGGK